MNITIYVYINMIQKCLMSDSPRSLALRACDDARDEVELQVGVRHLLSTADEATHLEVVRRADALPRQHPQEACLDGPPGLSIGVLGE